VGQMLYCTPDAMALVGEIATRRLSMVVGKAQRLNGGEPLSMTNERVQSLTLMRKLHFRFLSGDYRMTDREWGKVKNVGSWLHSLHAKTEGYSEKQFDWSNTPDFWTWLPAAPNTYHKLLKILASGDLERGRTEQ
jgi:hypothetical protein